MTLLDARGTRHEGSRHATFPPSSHDGSQDRHSAPGNGGLKVPEIETPGEEHAEEVGAKGSRRESAGEKLLRWLVPQWAATRLNWKSWRPVLRGAVAAWCGLLLMLIPQTEKMLGQASFLVLVVAMLAPAILPITSYIESFVLHFLLVTASWAWACLGLFLAHATRTEYKYSLAEFTSLASQPYIDRGMNASAIAVAVELDVLHGRYLEGSSSAICAVFLFIGSGTLLWLKIYLGPGPALFGTIFGTIMSSLSFTNGCLYPYPNYKLGLTFYLPWICQSAISLVATVLIFPETVAHQFSDRLIDVIVPVQGIIKAQPEMLRTNPRTPEWLQYASLRTSVNSAKVKLALLASGEANLTREITYARLSGKDLVGLLGLVRLVVSRTTGFVIFYDILERHLHRNIDPEDKDEPLVLHVGRSRQTSAQHTPSSTRPASIAGGDDDDEHDAHLAVPATHDHSEDASHGSLTDIHEHVSTTPDHLTARGRPRSHHHPKKKLHHVHAGHHATKHLGHGSRSNSYSSLPSLLHGVFHSSSQPVRPIGTLESKQYMYLEDRLSNPRDEAHIEEIVSLLAVASHDLLAACAAGLEHFSATVHRMKSASSRFKTLFKEDAEEYRTAIKGTEDMLDRLETALGAYRDVKRLAVVKPFATLFDPRSLALQDSDNLAAPSHRGLYWAFAYQYALLGWSEAFVDALKELARIEKKRRRPRFWGPSLASFSWSSANAEEDFGDLDPDTIPGLRKQQFSSARDPDYDPPDNVVNLVGVWLHRAAGFFSNEGLLFGIKAGTLFTLISIPAFLPQTAFFFFRERGLWVCIMAGLTLTRHVGDTFLSLVSRMVGTGIGVLVGMLAWYIAAGTGTGNPYGLAAICAVVFPLVVFFRLYYDTLMTAIVTAVTTLLVIGYSWQDGNTASLGTVGVGFPVAWRRFVAVMAGITAAWLFSYLPPRATQKRTIRKTYARVIGEIGTVLAQVISYANNSKKLPRKPPQAIVANITALRIKLIKMEAAKAFTKYEVSARGSWPSVKYAKLSRLQSELLDLIALFLMVCSNLDSAWRHALLARSQFINPRFLQDLLGTIQMVSQALSHPHPLPMVNVPLLPKFLLPGKKEHAYGYQVLLDDDEEIPGVPKHVDLDTISSLDYLRFANGISFAYAITNRIDQLMVVAKSLVGEQYVVFGLEDEFERGHPMERMGSMWQGEESRRHSQESLV